MIYRRKFFHVLGLAGFFSFLWWAFTDGSTYQLGLGIVVVLLATTAALMMPREIDFLFRARIIALIHFVPYFVYESLKGGLLVAWLAISPKSKIRSQYIKYRVRLPEEALLARMWFASALCVFPGTLSCGYNDDVLTVHVLDTGLFDLKAVRKLEEMTSGVFDTKLNTTGGSITA